VIGTGLTNQNFTYNTNDWLTGDVYDSNGSTRTNGPNIFFYDVANHLTNATVAGTTVAYTYTADGTRVSKTIAGTTTLYLVDDRNPSGYAQVLEELTVTGGTTNLAKVFTYGLDLIAQRDAGTGTRSFYGYDGNGNTRYLTGTNGAISDTYLYDAFGSLLTSTGSTANDYRYTGEQYDSTLGLYYLRARYVNPGIARFSTRDSYFGNPEYPLSLHKYLYCHDNPINMTDPVGSYSTYRQYYGYAVEDAIQDFYEEDHPGEKPILKSKRVFRKDTPAQWLFPDVFDPNRNKWLEVKPLSVPGVATGEAKRALNMMALPGDPELLWQPPLLLHIVPTGETFVSVNIAGVVYYQREDLVQAELLTAVASGVAYSAKDLLKYVSVQAGKALIQGSVRPVLSYTSSLALQGKAADYSRGQIMTSIAGLTTLMIGF